MSIILSNGRKLAFHNIEEKFKKQLIINTEYHKTKKYDPFGKSDAGFSNPSTNTVLQ